MIEHPIRSEPIHVYRAPDGQPGPAWIAKFGLGRAFPIHFEGASESDVRMKAFEFRANVLAKHEAAFIARAEAAEKARAATAKRKAAKEATA